MNEAKVLFGKMQFDGLNLFKKIDFNAPFDILYIAEKKSRLCPFTVLLLFSSNIYVIKNCFTLTYKPKLFHIGCIGQNIRLIQNIMCD